MNYNIFRWWERWGKPIIYVFVLIATAGLIAGYFFLSRESGFLSFAISIVYALLLFLVTILLNKIDNYTAEKLYEREVIYLTLKRLKDVTGATIQKNNDVDLKEFKMNVIEFQTFTGRSTTMVEARLRGEKVPVYIKERGFIFNPKMLQYENLFLELYDKDEVANKKKIAKCVKKLRKCYAKSCKQLEKNYSRIASIYGGALFELLDRDSADSDTEFSLSNIGSQVEEIIDSIGSLHKALDELTGDFCDHKRDIEKKESIVVERLNDIYDMLLDTADDSML